MNNYIIMLSPEIISKKKEIYSNISKLLEKELNKQRGGDIVKINNGNIKMFDTQLINNTKSNKKIFLNSLKESINGKNIL